MGFSNDILHASEPDTLARDHERPCVVFGVGANVWTEGELKSDGTASLSIARPFSQGLALQADFGIWSSKWSTVAAHIGISIRYDVRVGNGFTVYPRAGLGLVFWLPPFHATFGCGVWHALSNKLGIFVEAGGHLTYRDSQRRANYYFEAVYLGAGLTFGQ
jgi:hypothetical protein